MLILVCLLPLYAAQITISLPSHTIDTTDTRKKQITVPIQSKEVGGTSSCCYQALRNGILLSLAHQESDNWKHYIDLLKSNESAHHICNQNSEWRQTIRRHRAAKVTQDFLHDQLLNSFNAELKEITYSTNNKPDLYYKYKQSKGLIVTKENKEVSLSNMKALAMLLGEISKTVIDDQLTQQVISLSHKKFLELLQNAILKKVHEGGESATQYFVLQYSKAFLKYFKPTNISFRIQDDLSITDASGKKLLAQSKELPHGDWVQVEEIPLLLTYEKNKGWLQSAPTIRIAIYGDEGMNEEFDNLVNRFTTTSEDIIAPILIYTGNTRSSKNSYESESSYYARQTEKASFGHFFTIVVIRKGGTTDFLIADSLKNDRLQDRKVTEIICQLDGVAIPEESSSSLKNIVISLILAGSGYAFYKHIKKHKKQELSKEETMQALQEGTTPDKSSI